MTKKWSEVVQSPEYQAMSNRDREQAQGDYFKHVIAPQVPPQERGRALNEFYRAYPLRYDVTEDMTGPQKFLAGMGKAPVDLARGAGQMLGIVSEKDIAKSRREDANLMKTGEGRWGNVSGYVASAIPTILIPGANTATGSALVSATMGALQPTVGDESRTANTVTGGLFGLGGYGLAKGLGRGVGWASDKIKNINTKVATKAAETAASETATARSAAGNAAQNAYKQLEHLRELKAGGTLSREEARIMKELSEELATKAKEKLIPSAALKKSTAQAYREAIESESERAAAIAADKLGGSEVKRQVMARLLRYGPAAIGGVLGNMVFPGFGGVAAGAAGGLYLRPAIRSLVHLAKNPAVQKALLSPMANSKSLANPALPRALGVLAPSVSLSNKQRLNSLESIPTDEQ